MLLFFILLCGYWDFAKPMIDLIYCGGGNKRLAEIAINAGFKYGSQLPKTIYFPIYMADQDWKKPNREAYMKAIATHRPYIASVMDWERQEQLPEVLAWAEEAAAFVETVMIIPKVQGGIGRIPRMVGGKSVRLGFSVPTKFGGTQLPAWEFYGWPIHLLGGSPHAQMAIAKYLDVRSTDGNYASKIALRYCKFWIPRNTQLGLKDYWMKLLDADGKKWGTDAPYEAFRRSCQNIMAAWYPSQQIAADGGIPVDWPRRR